MKRDARHEVALMAYPNAVSAGRAKFLLPGSVTRHSEAIEGRDHVAEQFWQSLQSTPPAGARALTVQLSSELTSVCFIGPAPFVTCDGEALDERLDGVAQVPLERLRGRAVSIEDLSGWLLIASLDDDEHIGTTWYDTRPMVPIGAVGPPPLAEWVAAGGDAEVAGWAERRLEESDELGLDRRWSNVVVGGALLRLRGATRAEVVELERAVAERRLPFENAADQVVRSWSADVDPGVARHLAGVAVARALDVAADLEALAARASEATAPPLHELRAELALALEEREDVASVLELTRVPTSSDRDALAWADARARAAAERLPLISTTRESPRLMRAAAWDFEGWWLGNDDPDEAEADDWPDEA